MATVGGQYVQSVAYTTPPVTGTNNADLTSNTSNGITFPQSPNYSGLVDEKGTPRYIIVMNFYSPGVASLGSVAVKQTNDSNVNQITVQFFVPSAPNQPYAANPEYPNQILSVMSTVDNTRPSINSFSGQPVPSPLSGIRIIIDSTTDNL
jgi:hypothetical protein